jgi:hypothetical protein
LTNMHLLQAPHLQLRLPSTSVMATSTPETLDSRKKRIRTTKLDLLVYGGRRPRQIQFWRASGEGGRGNPDNDSDFDPLPRCDEPSEPPSDEDSPDNRPSNEPSASPSSGPSAQPSSSPTEFKFDPGPNTAEPSDRPLPSTMPSAMPSNEPSASPSSGPSAQPSSSPTEFKFDPRPTTAEPSDQPSLLPSGVPSESPAPTICVEVVQVVPLDLNSTSIDSAKVVYIPIGAERVTIELLLLSS